MEPGEQVTPVILGVPWQRAYNAIPIWQKDGIQLTVNGKEVFEPFLGEECYLPDSDDEDESQQADEVQESNPATAQQDVTKENPKTTMKPTTKVTGGNTQDLWIPKQLKKAQEGCSKIWVPKHLIPKTPKRQRQPKLRQLPPVPIPYPAGRTQTTQKISKQQWVKKTTLAAQGYYDGVEKIWLPKQPQTKPPRQASKQSKRRGKHANNQQVKNKRTPQRWVKKSTLKAQGYYQGATQLWLPTHFDQRTRQASQAWARPQQRQQQWQPKPTNNKTKQPTVRQVWLRKDRKKEQNGLLNKQHNSSTGTMLTKATWQQKGKWVPMEQTHTTPILLSTPTSMPALPCVSPVIAAKPQTQPAKESKTLVTKVDTNEEQEAPPTIIKLKPNRATQARQLLFSVFNKTSKHKELV